MNGRPPAAHLTAREVRAAWRAQACGNCGATSEDALYDVGCQQLLCGQCRKKKRALLRVLPAHIKLERRLYLAGMVVAGTHRPKENKGA